MRLQNKVALVTGGSMGIGQAVAERFSQEGAKVVISGRGKAALKETEEKIKNAQGDVFTVEVDVRHKRQVDRMVERVLNKWGRIDILVNNAGICSPAPFLDMTEEDWNRHIEINLTGTFLTSQCVAQNMVKYHVQGSIINMSSVNGLAAEADQAHYNASKGGINLLTMSMALDLATHGIRVNALCPGFIETRLTKPLINNKSAINNYVKTIPMGRVGQPEDIADSALFLASDESRYMTGHCLVVDGGQLIKLS